MNPIDAFYHTVHDQPGGAESLAPRMGMSAAVLRNKADPKKECNKPLLADVDKIMDLTGDYRVLRALAHKHGFLLVRAPENCTVESDMSVLEHVTGLMVAQGKFAQEIHTALADGDLSAKEMTKIEEVGQAFMTEVVEIQQRLRGMVG
ncbi:phage regulatory CII family protein [Pusillimonas sp. NJUB218]|uniref:phage regulatory CII family protein n=1 Tax=Pusillimonas sp. NJUB218 TaxID=2023230 RepID=UPI000F4B18FA|nr:phage regulatory CII family protein [Pusillimonas sp. NJUB218]ROT45027.1 hypothetical protein CHR62_09250 [Pusillimonas sp. NJUB218]